MGKIWGAAGSLCNTVKSQGRGENLHLGPTKIYTKKKDLDPIPEL